MITRAEALNTEKIGEDSDHQVQWFDKDNYEKRINDIFDWVEKLEEEIKTLKEKENVQ